MAVSYKKMFKLMIDHDMKRKDLKEKTAPSNKMPCSHTEDDPSARRNKALTRTHQAP